MADPHGSNSQGPELFTVQAAEQKPLVDFMINALRLAGCRILYVSEPGLSPYRITFETAGNERMGIIGYAFLASSKRTTNHPDEEYSFQTNYDLKDGLEHELWQDPLGLHVTLLLGINPELGFFVGADPVLHSPLEKSETFIIGKRDVNDILSRGWHAWEREHVSVEDALEPPVEVLVGGAAGRFLDFVRFEREALREDQGTRDLLADRIARKVVAA